MTEGNSRYPDSEKMASWNILFYHNLIYHRYSAYMMYFFAFTFTKHIKLTFPLMPMADVTVRCQNNGLKVETRRVVDGNRLTLVT